MKQPVFMLSDGTGITAENLGNSLITQFENIDFEKFTIPYIDTIAKAEAAVIRINQCFAETGKRPLVFITLLNPDIAKMINASQGYIFDLFHTFLSPLEQVLQEKSSYRIGRMHGVSNSQSYSYRIEAIDYALTHDDGVNVRNYHKADLVLIGISRCGKTPSCIYLALHFGILAANYPFTEEDFNSLELPAELVDCKKKLFGLTIDPERLQHIRHERLPNSKYASLEQCRFEVKEVEAMYERENIPYLNSTRYSVEEIATKILAGLNIKRRF
ncbi:MAG: kinase/pyrophosphorylase [Legionella sp.]|nr:kinase/pyrophosphorylase [Legionella sp.]